MKINSNKSRSVLIALPNDTLGGAEQYLKMIAHQFADEQYQVYVLFVKQRAANGWSSFDNLENVRLKYTNKNTERKGLFEFIKQLWNVRKISFDYVFTSHVHLTGLLGFFIGLGILKKKYFIGRESTSIFIRFTGLKLTMFKLLYWMGYSQLDLLICQTKFMKDQLVKAMPWIDKKIKVEVVPNPIDLSLNPNGEIPANELVLYGKYIVSAGRLIPEKGFDILIRVFAKLLPSYPWLNLLILGEGKEREALTKLATELNVANRVFMIGFVNDVYKYFKRSHLCVVSSRIEGFPNVLLQKMSQNNRVVSTKCAGGIEDIEGISIAEANNEVSLQNALIKALDLENPDARALFDKQLNDRSISKFVDRLKETVSNK